ncbi:MAG TPA: serine/threonine protein kinase, partial [Anaerolineae bacterium]
MTLQLGDFLNDRYRIEEVVGHGGFSTVHRAYDQTLHSDVAVKEFNPESAARFGDPRDMKKRLELEARITRLLKH